MSSSELRVSLEVIRREAELACEAASLRAVAAEIGMSPMGVRAFILGAGKPQERTERKLNRWYAHRIATRESPGADAARAALILLAGLYPQADRARVQRNFLEQMAREFHASRMQPPSWLAALSDEVGRTAG
jgi:hypothetical protein